MNPNADIVNASGRVFARDNLGMCSVQLYGYPSIIRVRPLRQGIAHQLKLQNCSELTPTDVFVDIGEFGTTQHFFHGAIRIADCDGGELAQFEQVKSRRLMTMVL